MAYTSLRPRNTTILVDHLPPNIVDEHLFEFFSRFGKILSIRTKRPTRNSEPAYAYIEYANFESVMAAVAEANNTKVFGRLISVKPHSLGLGNDGLFDILPVPRLPLGLPDPLFPQMVIDQRRIHTPEPPVIEPSREKPVVEKERSTPRKKSRSSKKKPDYRPPEEREARPSKKKKKHSSKKEKNASTTQPPPSLQTPPLPTPPTPTPPPQPTPMQLMEPPKENMELDSKSIILLDRPPFRQPRKMEDLLQAMNETRNLYLTSLGKRFMPA